MAPPSGVKPAARPGIGAHLHLRLRVGDREPQRAAFNCYTHPEMAALIATGNVLAANFNRYLYDA